MRTAFLSLFTSCRRTRLLLVLLVRFPLLSAEDLLLSAQLRLLYQAVQVLQGLPLLTLVLVALLLLPPPPPPFAC